MTKMYMRGRVYYGTGAEMMDRIDELEAALVATCQREAKTISRHDAKVETLEAKLAKAFGLLEAWVNVAAHCTIEEGVCCCGFDMASHGNPLDHNHMPVDHGAYVAGRLMKETSATLAELTGGQDD